MAKLIPLIIWIKIIFYQRKKKDFMKGRLWIEMTDRIPKLHVLLRIERVMLEFIYSEILFDYLALHIYPFKPKPKK